MDKSEFQQLFLHTVHRALENVSRGIGIPLSAEFDIELHGGGVPGEIISQDRAVDIMYLGEDKFYRVIDVGVKHIDSNNRARVFVRISSHQPSTFENTWNDPPGTGPFKVIDPMGDIRTRSQ